MPDVIFNHIEISGISACIPSQVKLNMDYQWIAKDKRKQLIDLTGIEQRHVAPPGIHASDMCRTAAEKLLQDLNISPKDIGIMLFVSQSRDYYLPHTSAILQHTLGLSQQCLVSDISMGCSGYVYGLSFISSLLEHSDAKYGLLLAGDVSTRSTSYMDKSTYPLFGDAGTATIVKKTDKPVKSQFSYGNDGSRFESIIIRNGMSKHHSPRSGFRKRKISQGIYRSKMDLELNGPEIFHFAITDVPVHIKSLMKKTGLEANDIDFFILHQANRLMLETIGKILKVPKEKIPIHLDRYGNTSSASIPLCMVTEIQEQLRNRKLRLLLSGFGVGLSMGSAVIETNCIHISDLQYIDA